MARRVKTKNPSRDDHDQVNSPGMIVAGPTVADKPLNVSHAGVTAGRVYGLVSACHLFDNSPSR